MRPDAATKPLFTRLPSMKPVFMKAPLLITPPTIVPSLETVPDRFVISPVHIPALSIVPPVLLADPNQSANSVLVIVPVLEATLALKATLLTIVPELMRSSVRTPLLTMLAPARLERAPVVMAPSLSMNPAFVIEVEKIELAPLVENVPPEPMLIGPAGAKAEPMPGPATLNMPADTVVSPVWLVASPDSLSIEGLVSLINEPEPETTP